MNLKQLCLLSSFYTMEDVDLIASIICSNSHLEKLCLPTDESFGFSLAQKKRLLAALVSDLFERSLCPSLTLSSAGGEHQFGGSRDWEPWRPTLRGRFCHSTRNKCLLGTFVYYIHVHIYIVACLIHSLHFRRKSGPSRGRSVPEVGK